MANLVVLTGRIFQAELKYTSNGKAVAQASISFKTGKNKKDYDYINLTFWDASAERIAKLTQGDDNNVMATVYGYLKQDKWESKKGEKRSRVVLTVTNFEVIDTDSTFLSVGNDDGQKKKTSKKSTKKRKPVKREEQDEDDSAEDDTDGLDDGFDLPF